MRTVVVVAFLTVVQSKTRIYIFFSLEVEYLNIDYVCAGLKHGVLNLSSAF